MESRYKGIKPTNTIQNEDKDIITMYTTSNLQTNKQTYRLNRTRTSKQINQLKQNISVKNI